ncbi:hypothetical protein, partial [Neomoorella mulderi]|uniref:hypothetical protein n=1 Tax=Neomoorella mulderi TaxID=202604 RepID=UPI001F2B239C
TNAFMLAEQFAQESVIAPPVFSLSELHYLLTDIIREGMSGFTTTISMGQTCWARGLKFFALRR